MTQEEILEYNKRCGEFLGWKETSEQFKIDWVGCKTKERLNKINKDYIPILEKDGNLIFPDFAVMNFSRDWNLIMEVCIAIKNIQNPREHSDTTCSTLKREIQSHLGSANKKAAIQAINQFLIWYNEQNK